MTTETVFQRRVQAGSEWLDLNYPGWWKSINIAELELSSCRQCVLGQVWTGHIPVGERKQLLAQVVAGFRLAWDDVNLSGDGYTWLRRAHGLTPGLTTEMGFALHGDEAPMGFDRVRTAWATLRDEWIKVIVSRRLASEPQLVAELEPVKVLVNA